MTSFLKTIYRPGAFDGLFAVIGLIALYGIYYSLGEGEPAIQAAADPFPKALVLLAAVLVATLIACLFNRFDQRLADDFTFQTLAKSSMIAVFAFVFALMAWAVLFQRDFGRIPQRTTVAMLVVSWSLAYFYTRFRGTRA